MTDKKALVEFLADGAFHSGEAIGVQMGVSRAAVWKQLKKLNVFGLRIESVKGRGYRLPEKLELHRVEALSESIEPHLYAYISELELLFEVGSTNAWAMQKLNAGEAGKGYCCLAEFQHQGRGRRGRPWLSPLASNITLSLIWSFDEGAASLGGLSLAVGVAMVRALRSQGLDRAQLKWPNDILVEGRKLGGILLEMVGDPAGVCQVVIGVGLNVHMKPGDVSLDQAWTALSNYLPWASRNTLAAAMISELLQLLIEFPKGGFEAVRSEWMSCDAFRGSQVELLMGESCQRGEVLGVASDGALLLDIAGKVSSFHGGEISLRSLDKVL